MQKGLSPPQAVRLAVRPGEPNDFDLWRWSISPVFDIDAPDPRERSAFGLVSDAFGFDRLRISQTRCGALQMRRSEGVIARANIDAFMCILYRSGGVRFRAGAREGESESGDVLLLDLSRPCELAGGEHYADSLVFERADIARVTGVDADLHGLLLKRGAPLAEIFKAAAWAALAEAPKLHGEAAQAASLALGALVGHCFAPAVRLGEAAVVGLAHAAFRRARAEIERGLADPRLDADALAHRCGISRTALYRLFEPHGGVAAYVRRERLARARRRLAGPGGERIAEIARDCGFENATVFGRRFREAFAISPRDFREAARLKGAELSFDRREADAAFDSVTRWFDFD